MWKKMYPGRFRVVGTAAVALSLASGLGAAEPGVVRDSLMLEYDFSAGSLPAADGAVKDLSGNGLDGVIRPCEAALPELETGAGWRPHLVRQGDGRGGWLERRAQLQFLRHPGGKYTMPFGLVQMDNGEVALIGSWHNGKSEQPVICFSRDRGATWTEWLTIPGAAGRPMNLTDLGAGKLTFRANRRFFSADHGRTWPDSIKVQPTADGLPFHVEGNTWVDRDAAGLPERVAALGWRYENGEKWPAGAAITLIRWSYDGCRTWTDEVKPRPWVYETEYNGKVYRRGVSEGAIVRAANGWLVAAVRTDMPARFLNRPHSDHFEGTGVSISKDDGKTWSPLNWLYDAGRMHANLQRLPDGTLVMTMVVRQDMITGSDGKYASYRRGCDALISRDNGLTWDLRRRFELHAFEHPDPAGSHPVICGHIAAVALDDGSVISAYGNYQLGAAVLVEWRPDGEIVAAPAETPVPAVRHTMYDQIAAPDRDYATVTAPGQPTRLRLTGTAWIDVPAAPALLALSDNATFEFVLAPREQTGFVTLFYSVAPTADVPYLGFGICYDRRPGTNTQAVYADERAQRAPPDYAVNVDVRSIPTPVENAMHQLAYVVTNGKGRFFRNGQPYSIQKKTGTADRTHLFQFVVSRTNESDNIRIAIGARPGLDRVTSQLQGDLLAVRVYDRALTPAELRRNQASALQAPPN